MNLFSRRNLWKISPLLIAALFWATGYIFSYYEPLADLLCDRYNGSCRYSVGFPLLVISQFFIGAGLVMLFARLDTLKRWSIFAGVYLVATTITLAFTKVSAGGFDFPERLTVAQIFGIIFLIVTILW